MDAVTPHLDVDLPPAPWVAVPVDGDDDWARRSADELCEGSPAAEPLAAELAVALRRAAEPGVLACAVVVPEEPPQRVTAVLVVEHVACDDVEAALTALTTVGPAVLGTPDVRRVALPLGDAVRRHVLTAEGDDGTGGVVERVEHVVPLGDGTGVRADLTWTPLALGDELVELADGVAVGLRLTER